MSIRFARKADCAAIAEIYNHAVLYTAAIWNDQTVDADNRIAWFEARTLAGYPVLVSEENGVVTGYASFGDWRSFDGFRHTVEHSVYVHPDHQGKGLGRKLLSRLIDEARDCGKHVMVAGIESQNQASLHLHQSLGFVVTAQMPQVGTKFGRWLDLHLCSCNSTSALNRTRLDESVAHPCFFDCRRNWSGCPEHADGAHHPDLLYHSHRHVAELTGGDCALCFYFMV